MARTKLEREIKSTVLRPLADAFGKLARQIDSGEYELPKTPKEAEELSESIIAEIYDRLDVIMNKLTLKVSIESLQWALDDYTAKDTDTKANLEQFIKELEEKLNNA